jgi:hypothetical protein
VDASTMIVFLMRDASYGYCSVRLMSILPPREWPTIVTLPSGKC